MWSRGGARHSPAPGHEPVGVCIVRPLCVCVAVVVVDFGFLGRWC